MVEVIGLEIRWFSFYMIGLYYLLLFPDNWYAASAKWLARPLAPVKAWFQGESWEPMRQPVQTRAWVWGGTLVSVALVWFLPMPGSRLAALTIGLAMLGTAIGRFPQRQTLVLQVAFALLVLLVPLKSGAAYDFHRYRGADLLRQGDLDGAIVSYRLAVRINDGPDSRHAKLGELLLRQDRYEEAMDVFVRGLVHATGKKKGEKERFQKGLEEARQGGK